MARGRVSRAHPPRRRPGAIRGLCAVSRLSRGAGRTRVSPRGSASASACETLRAVAAETRAGRTAPRTPRPLAPARLARRRHARQNGAAACSTSRRREPSRLSKTTAESAPYVIGMESTCRTKAGRSRKRANHASRPGMAGRSIASSNQRRASTPSGISAMVKPIRRKPFAPGEAGVGDPPHLGALGRRRGDLVGAEAPRIAHQAPKHRCHRVPRRSSVASPSSGQLPRARGCPRATTRPRRGGRRGNGQ